MHSNMLHLSVKFEVNKKTKTVEENAFSMPFFPYIQDQMFESSEVRWGAKKSPYSQEKHKQYAGFPRDDSYII